MILHLMNYDGSGTIPFEVKRPSLVRMMAEGKIPNHLKRIAIDQLEGRGKPEGEKNYEYGLQLYELFCRACMVKPTYEEVKEQITDEQMSAILIYAMNPQIALESFCEERPSPTGNTPSQENE